eukprot:GILK01003741.1.p1 GENE.GILK01003741.1~~GILK01003741.1.p1  ORF type:complete len:912 (+),score=76.30 GILK01003741.1:340-2736(+)
MTDCNECISQSFCGFCTSNSKCIDGNNKGPLSSECPDFSMDLRGMKVQLSAWNHKTKPHSCEAFTSTVVADDKPALKPRPKRKQYKPPLSMEADDYLNYGDNYDDVMENMKNADFDAVASTDPEDVDLSGPGTAPDLHGEDSPVIVPELNPQVMPDFRKKFEVVVDDGPPDTRPMYRMPVKNTPMRQAAPKVPPVDKMKPAFQNVAPTPLPVLGSDKKDNGEIVVTLSQSPLPVLQPAVMYDDFDNGLSEKWTGDPAGSEPKAKLVVDPTGLDLGQTLIMTECNDRGSVFSRDRYSSDSGMFRLEFEYYGIGNASDITGGAIGFCEKCDGDTYWLGRSTTPLKLQRGQTLLTNYPVFRHYAIEFKYNISNAMQGVKIVIGDTCEDGEGVFADALFQHILLYQIKLLDEPVSLPSIRPTAPLPAAPPSSLSGSPKVNATANSTQAAAANRTNGTIGGSSRTNTSATTNTTRNGTAASSTGRPTNTSTGGNSTNRPSFKQVVTQEPSDPEAALSQGFWRTLNEPECPSSILAAGEAHSCAIDAYGAVRCWGYAGDGRTSVPSGHVWLQIVAGYFHTCGIDSSRDMSCWGLNQFFNNAIPPEGHKWKSLSTNAVYHTCGITSEDSLLCWGNNDHSQCVSPPNRTWNRVSCGMHHTCGITRDGQLLCWGDNSQSQCKPPVRTTWKHISAGSDFTCGISLDDQLYCWGNGASGQLTFPLGYAWKTVAAGDSHACGLTKTGLIFCWGNNDYGQIQAPANTAAKTIILGRYHTCMVSMSDDMVCWGKNEDGNNNVPNQSLKCGTA